MRFLAALLIVPAIGFTLPSDLAVAQDGTAKQRLSKKRNLAAQCRKPAFAANNPKSCARFAGQGAPAVPSAAASSSTNAPEQKEAMLAPAPG